MARAKKDQEFTASDDISGETPAIEAQNEPKVEIVAETPAKSDVKTAEEGVAELKERLKSSEEARQRAERERNEAVSRAYQAKNEKDDTDARLLDSAQSQLVESNRNLKAQYAWALQNQDYAAAADIQEAMALNQAKALQLENGKQALKERPREAPSPLDPVEAFISNAKLGPKPAAWIRSHPEYATNGRMTEKMIAADKIAADDYERGSDEYFAEVESLLKIRRAAPPPMDDDYRGEQFSDASRATSGRQTAPAAIPVSREVSSSGQRQRTVRLTSQEVEAAELSGLTPAEYYANKQAVEDERRSGRLN